MMETIRTVSRRASLKVLLSPRMLHVAYTPTKSPISKYRWEESRPKCLLCLIKGKKKGGFLSHGHFGQAMIAPNRMLCLLT